jgi:hypothetical protein
VPFFDDRATANMVKIVARGRRKTSAAAAVPAVVASRLQTELETWAQNFSEGLKAEGQERAHDKNLKGDLQAFALLCAGASELLTNLALSPALSGATPARVYLAAAMSGADALADETIEADTKLEALRGACEGLAASLTALIVSARAAAKAEARTGKPPEGEKLAAVNALLSIFEGHSATPAKRTVGKGGGRGAFSNFLKIAFDAVGVTGNVDEWAKKAIRSRDAKAGCGGKGKK